MEVFQSLGNMDAIVHRPDNAKPHVDVDIFACGLLGLPLQSLSCFQMSISLGFYILAWSMEHSGVVFEMDPRLG